MIMDRSVADFASMGLTLAATDAIGAPAAAAAAEGSRPRLLAERLELVEDLWQTVLRSECPPQQAERRLDAWFDASERYARQLHEMDKATYVALKRQELDRMRTVLP